MQDNLMEYPEMYYIYWWAGEIAGVLRFTPEKDIGGAFFIDKTKPFEILWSKNEKMKDWMEKVLIKTQLSRKRFTEDKYEFVTWIFGKEPKQ